MSIVPFSAANHAIRYVIAPDQLAFVTILSTGVKFVTQAAPFRNVAGVSPRAALGSTTITAAELVALGFIPSVNPARKEVPQYDRTPVSV
jgi:hypothetical protein